MQKRHTSAILGTGMIAAVHARAVRAAGGDLRGVASLTAALASEAAERWGAPTAYPTMDAMLGDPSIDVVHICTPNVLHYEQVAAALRAGKHVIAEKPLATSASDAEELVDLARSVDRVLAVPFVYRYHPLVHEIRRRRMAGELGAIQLIHGSYLQDWLLDPATTNWRVDAAAGGPSRAFADIGSHWCDLVEWVSGIQFSEVTARLAAPVASRTVLDAHGDKVARPAQTEDVAVVLLSSADGVLANVTISQISPGRKNRLWFELDGAVSSAVFDQEQPETVWLGGSDVSKVLARQATHGSAGQQGVSALPPGHPQGYNECFASFVAEVYRAVDGEVTESLPTGHAGLRSARLVESVLASRTSGAWEPVAMTEVGSTSSNR